MNPPSYAEILLWGSLTTIAVCSADVTMLRTKGELRLTTMHSLRLFFIGLPFVLAAIPTFRHGVTYDVVRLWGILTMVYLIIRKWRIQRS